MTKRYLIAVFLLFAFACSRKAEAPLEFGPQHISGVIDEMTEVMVNDVTNPPLAGRFFAYATLAGYEVVSQHDSTQPSMHGLLNDYPQIAKPAGLTGYSYQLSALLAMLETAQKMQPSGAMLAAYQTQFLDSCRTAGVPEEVIAASLQYAQAVSQQVLAYAKADKYNRISNYARYSPTGEEGTWQPTPPGFFAPVEPQFNTLRTLTLDTCSQFQPAAPVPFSTKEDSEFYTLLRQCQQQGAASLSKENQQIAAFWDCNPFALQENGHLMVGMKKISPGAHWLGITGLVCQQANKSFSEAMEIHTVLSVALMDGFISCWDEKYRSNRIRPETAIRKYLDPSWKPFLQTPPFPEYLSGHSTISAASAVVLTHYFGDDFKFVDTVEERYHLPARSFDSFQQAAIEAGMSRFYGGIHFIDAIDNGRVQGLQVGAWVLRKTGRLAETSPEAVAQK
ncbi:vanadium-dependent haloperoxidase [Pontibacter sp. E15-1]|uniref:vanadium-dependent haloperoxidase n=1 Tax=Pontibacter sp. E15-1 TaxID=2919918 RepID=UPI001F4F135B|nr:vanadium-dependent haloperoxidase [Pontibacter sp. E15-1]MCJ8165872.1 vanadium-dependent haloperoxidase [Pontibacter sp. E15-1]